MFLLWLPYGVRNYDNISEFDPYTQGYGPTKYDNLSYETFIMLSIDIR